MTNTLIIDNQPPTGKAILATLLELLAEQNQVKITYEIIENE